MGPGSVRTRFGLGLPYLLFSVAIVTPQAASAQAAVPVWGAPNVPIRLQTRPVDGRLYRSVEFEASRRYAAVGYTVTPGASYTLEYRAIRLLGHYGYMLFDGNPLAANSDARGLLSSGLDSGRRYPERPPRPQKLFISIDPRSTGRTLLVILVYGPAEKEPVKEIPFDILLHEPARPYLSAEIVPGWESEGKLMISEMVNRGDPILLRSRTGKDAGPSAQAPPPTPAPGTSTPPPSRPPMPPGPAPGPPAQATPPGGSASVSLFGRNLVMNGGAESDKASPDGRAVLPISGWTVSGNKDGLLRREASGILPPGTRSIVVTLSMKRAAGKYNDGYADDLSFVLSGP